LSKVIFQDEITHARLLNLVKERSSYIRTLVLTCEKLLVTFGTDIMFNIWAKCH